MMKLDIAVLICITSSKKVNLIVHFFDLFLGNLHCFRYSVKALNGLASDAILATIKKKAITMLAER